ncbi:MAG: peptide chain release factor 1 [Candidatus Krumholzibacteria bacterium]|jgi:peptide chain release factor 1|nr:peptide chain release factor 1 [Candidatus Krumholzibacteria bacterium]MDP6668804.1 peptide chain release factor 1 [Candidatus Krumholzibacteria bacterium]MDP6796930.1 peptide chain release factor 1 [Candidatus Krumholzibacteria bacterium]MDP7022325.1 peptide chain release factor 1 [Candidatus Krumholzibacteria bacterium]
MKDLSGKVDKVLNRLEEVEKHMVDPAVLSDRRRAKEVGGEYKHLKAVAEVGRRWLQSWNSLAEARELLEAGDDELAELAQQDIAEVEELLPVMEKELELLLVPKDPDDDRNLILEVRAGTGGDEAALFAGDLHRMYQRHTEKQGWKMEVLSSTEGSSGGLKEIIIGISGEGAYGRLKFESGVHRVQRIPATESSGRIHTSAASVVVMPEVEEVEFDIDENELRIDVYRSSGPGGQSVNTTDSAVRITHEPTGLVVSCQDEKSQHKNKSKALKILASRLYDLKKSEQEAEISAQRKSMVGTGDRSAKIRTYNFPQGRITDHRISMTLYSLAGFMEGEINEMIDALILDYRESLLAVDSP